MQHPGDGRCQNPCSGPEHKRQVTEPGLERLIRAGRLATSTLVSWRLRSTRQEQALKGAMPVH
jgi:hypothetical protein